jgi:hypothetical protein
MASTTLISVSEYLKTTYRPDCDFVDGRIEERNVGEHDHAALQAALIYGLGSASRSGTLKCFPSSASRFPPAGSAFLMFA